MWRAWCKMRSRGADATDSLWKILISVDRKWSTRLNYLIHLSTRVGQEAAPTSKALKAAIKAAKRKIDLEMCWEEAKKAPLLSNQQIRQLSRESDPKMAVLFALMLPAGSRFADVQRLRPMDVVAFDVQTGTLVLKVKQAKNIRARRHQRFQCLRIPVPLRLPLRTRLSACPPGQTIIEVSYRHLMRYLKAKFGPQVTSYSIRRTVLNLMRGCVSTIEEMATATLHRNTDQLRMYLDAPLPDEARTQIAATSWHEALGL